MHGDDTEGVAFIQRQNSEIGAAQRVALSKMILKTRCRSPGELEMIAKSPMRRRVVRLRFI